MKVRASIKKRSADCKIVRRKGRLYIINTVSYTHLDVYKRQVLLVELKPKRELLKL